MSQPPNGIIFAPRPHMLVVKRRSFFARRQLTRDHPRLRVFRVNQPRIEPLLEELAAPLYDAER